MLSQAAHSNDALINLCTGACIILVNSKYIYCHCSKYHTLVNYFVSCLLHLEVFADIFLVGCVCCWLSVCLIGGFN